MCQKQVKGIPRTLEQHIQTCSICRNNYDPEQFDKKSPLVQIMTERGICFQCAFWSDKIENPDPNREIINGEHYTFHPFQKNPLYFQGHGGRIFYILHNDKSLLRSNNVWFQGIIPDRFKEKLPNTAKLISKKTYSLLKINNFTCKTKGCWDRYHCIRYDLSIEKNSKPWNIVPKNHVIGSERCVNFVNMNEL
jgi:hypothetical protein